MSVILDALHKARGDRRGGSPAEPVPHEQTVARVLDAASAVPTITATPRPSRRREWMIAFGVIVGLAILFALASGAFLLLYQQLRQIGNSSAPAAVAPGVLQPAAPVATIALPAVIPPAVMTTPIPLSELPVQTPAENASASAVPAAARADFTLGSIVCENNDCIASLNNRSVRVGDVVRGYKVIAIESTSVKLQGTSGQGELNLSLFD